MPRLAPVTRFVLLAIVTSVAPVLRDSAPLAWRPTDIDPRDGPESPWSAARLSRRSGRQPPPLLRRGSWAAELTGGRPNSPNRSGLRKATILAIPVLVTLGSVTACAR